jgi:erythromycin esterase-like protein
VAQPEVYDFLSRLHAANAQKNRKEMAGFFGLDIYSVGASIDAVLAYLDQRNPTAAHTAGERYGCLAPWRAEPTRYGRMALSPAFKRCEDEAIRVLGDLLDFSPIEHDGLHLVGCGCRAQHGVVNGLPPTSFKLVAR